MEQSTQTLTPQIQLYDINKGKKYFKSNLSVTSISGTDFEVTITTSKLLNENAEPIPMYKSQEGQFRNTIESREPSSAAEEWILMLRSLNGENMVTIVNDLQDIQPVYQAPQPQNPVLPPRPPLPVPRSAAPTPSALSGPSLSTTSSSGGSWFRTLIIVLIVVILFYFMYKWLRKRFLSKKAPPVTPAVPTPAPVSVPSVAPTETNVSPESFKPYNPPTDQRTVFQTTNPASITISSESQPPPPLVSFQ